MLGRPLALTLASGLPGLMVAAAIYSLLATQLVPSFGKTARPAMFDLGGPAPGARLPVAANSAVWHPPLNTAWQWQMDTPVDQTVAAAMFDIDLFENDATVVAALHRQNKRVVCYVNAGAWENWRPDARQMPAKIIGKSYSGWPGEKWLDIRNINLLAPVMRARLDQCKAKGFDAVEPDNIDGYVNDTGFPITAEDQLRYNRWLAAEAHERGLSIGLKNDADQADELLPYFDWALTEDCFGEGWCEQLVPFIEAGKAVFAAEYTDSGIKRDQFCGQANAMNFNAILKHRELDAWRQVCR